jgi:hypothetical protein
LMQTATIVHHLSYEHVFGELCWELVGVCESCHDRVHGPSMETATEYLKADSRQMGAAG